MKTERGGKNDKRYIKNDIAETSPHGQFAQDGNLRADDGKPIVGKEKENEKTNINYQQRRI